MEAKHIRKTETNQSSPKFLKKLMKLRQKICDWLCIIHIKIPFDDGIFFTTIQIFDRFLKTQIKEASFETLDKLDLFLITCLIISFKYHNGNNDRPKISLFQKHLLFEKYSNEEILKTELFLLKKINFVVPNLNEHVLLIKEDYEGKTLIVHDLLKNFLLKLDLVNNFLFLDDGIYKEEYGNILTLVKKISTKTSKNEEEAKILLKYLKRTIKDSKIFIKDSYFDKNIFRPFLRKMKVLLKESKSQKRIETL